MERKFDTTTAFSGGLWLVGMSFPLTVVFLLDLSVSERIAGIAAITAFSLFYLAALGYGHAYPYTADWARFVFWALPLIACVAILTAVIKSHAVVLLPYFAAFCQVCLSPRRGFIALTAIVLAAASIAASFPVEGSWTVVESESRHQRQVVSQSLSQPIPNCWRPSHQALQKIGTRRARTCRNPLSLAVG